MCLLSEFPTLSEDDVSKLIKGFAAKSCLLDNVSTWFVESNPDIFVPIVTQMANVSFSTGVFPSAFSHKHALKGILQSKYLAGRHRSIRNENYMVIHSTQNTKRFGIFGTLSQTKKLIRMIHVDVQVQGVPKVTPPL